MALAALASLFVASERYPVVANIGSAAIRAQDLIFVALIAASAREIARWCSRVRVLAVALATFLLSLFVSAMHSPAGTSAVVAIVKYGEFVVAGVAIGLFLRRFARPDLVTGLLACGVAMTASVALVDVVGHAGTVGITDERSGGLLSTESAAAVAALAAVWCAVRLTRLESRHEQRMAILGLICAGAVVLLAKSVLAVGAVLALVVLSPMLRSRWLRLAGVTCALLLVVAAVGRGSDIRSAVGLGGTAVTPRATIALPPPGRPSELPLPHVRREPANVTGGSFVHRVALGFLGLRIAADAPLFGHGWLATSDPKFLRSGPYDEYMLERFPRLDPNLLASNFPTGSHNAYLQAFSEAGAPAALLLIAVLLLAFVPALATIARHGAVASWQVACGTGWLIVIGVFLASSNLFGGQFETCMLGAALATCAPAASVRVGLRTWLVATGALLLLAAAFAALLLFPRPAGAPSPLERVRAVDAAGREAFAVGSSHRPPWAATLRNGLVEAWVRGDAIYVGAPLRNARGDDAWRPVARARGLASARAAVLERRSADATTLRFVPASGGPAVRLTMARGVPGVYVSLTRRHSLVIDRVNGFALGSRLDYAESPVVAFRQRLLSGLTPVVAARDEGAAVLLPVDRSRIAVRGRRLTADAVSGASVFFIASLPFDGSAAAPGTYAYLPSNRARGLRIGKLDADSTPAWAERTSLLFPWVMDDHHRSGVAELVSLGVRYRASAAR